MTFLDTFQPARFEEFAIFPMLKGTNPALKSRRIYPKYMPKCSVGSTNYVCNFLPKNIE